MTLYAEQYDFTLSLLLLENEVRAFHDAESEIDTHEKFTRTR
jgi:hypothetical protein